MKTIKGAIQIMNYITNQNDQIIAADDSLLALLDVESIEELTKQIILDNINFTTLSKQSIRISTDAQTFVLTSHVSVLSSVLGSLNLILLEKPAKEDSSVFISHDELVHTDEAQDTQLSLDDELFFIKEDEAPTTLTSPKDPLLTDDDEIDLLSTSTDDDFFGLIVPQVPEETIDNITMDEITTAKAEIFDEKDDIPILDTSPIIIDLKKVSEIVGVSQEDYKIFLDEYIDVAISLEYDLKSTNDEKRSSAIATLTQLSSVLHLPLVNEAVDNMPLKFSENEIAKLESFYSILARFTTSHEPLTEENHEMQEIFTSLKEPVLEEISIKEPEPILDDKGFGSIDLSDTKSIHFDFQVEEAASDLSLPVELIEEFVNDFIEQAKTETKLILQAYEEGDLDSIQKSAHMLKGASSNLRINALSDTLYKIQFCKDSTKLESYIKNYWGYFMSLEQQVDILKNKRN